MLRGRLLPFSGVPRRAGPPGKAVGRVVQIGKDPDLLRLRGKLLMSAGHSVYSLAPDQAYVEVDRADDLQLWIFCHTLTFRELARLALAIRASRPADKLLLLAGLHGIGQAANLFDEILKPAASVDELLMVVASLMSRTVAQQTR